MNVLNNDVIAAISTATGVGAIGIVRLSGEEVLTVVDKLYRNHQGTKLSDFKTHTIHHGYIVDKDDKKIDEVLVSIMRAPHSYTAEDVVEINCHGGPVALKSILKAAVDAGARLAEPGEFTRRAFINGRIDLSQAEAVMDIIDAKTEKGLRYSLNQLSGGLSKVYDDMDAKLLHLMTFIDAALDYPEYDVPEVTNQTLDTDIHELISQVDELLATAHTGEIYRDGVDTAIVGEPNVGKSSLLNKLLRQDRALVTNIPGTTRDTVEAYLDIDGVPFHMIDTAGIRQTDDVVEKLGVEKSKEVIDQAELVIFMTDVSRETSNEERALYDQIKNYKKVIFVSNKSDLVDDTSAVKDDADNHVVLSLKTEDGLNALRQKMVETVREDLNGTSTNTSQDVIVSNMRHVSLLKDVRENLTNALSSLNAGMPVDLVAIDLKDALENLRKITGRAVGEDIIDQIFANFCLGK